MDVIKIKDWSHFQRECFAGAWQADFKKFRSNLVFRGVNDAKHADLQTAVQRLGKDSASLEPGLLRNFKKYSPPDLVGQATDWHWLSVAQHHGLPTRLLDWTTSPLVGLHFAISDIDKMGYDGAVYTVDIAKVHKTLPQEFRKAFKESKIRLFTVELLAKLVGNELKRFRSQWVLFFEPPSMDARIINQYALFSVASDSRLSLIDWLNDHPGVLRKLVIPKKLKWEFRDRLDQANITERVLFPGLDGLSDWLRRHYADR